MRVNKGSKTFAVSDDASTRGDATRDDYMSRLVKLVPTESIAAYPILNTAAGTVLWAQVFASWALLFATIILRWHNSKHPLTSKPQWSMVFISSVSFVVWVEAFGGTFGLLAFLQAYCQGCAKLIEGEIDFLTTLALVLWTILVPVFYTGD